MLFRPHWVLQKSENWQRCPWNIDLTVLFFTYSFSSLKWKPARMQKCFDAISHTLCKISKTNCNFGQGFIITFRTMYQSLLLLLIFAQNLHPLYRPHWVLQKSENWHRCTWNNNLDGYFFLLLYLFSLFDIEACKYNKSWKSIFF